MLQSRGSSRRDYRKHQKWGSNGADYWTFPMPPIMELFRGDGIQNMLLPPAMVVGSNLVCLSCHKKTNGTGNLDVTSWAMEVHVQW